MVTAFWSSYIHYFIQFFNGICFQNIQFTYGILLVFGRIYLFANFKCFNIFFWQFPSKVGGDGSTLRQLNNSPPLPSRNLCVPSTYFMISFITFSSVFLCIFIPIHCICTGLVYLLTADIICTAQRFTTSQMGGQSS